MQENAENIVQEQASANTGYGLDPLFIKEVESFLEEAETEKLLHAVLPLHPADIAELISSLSNEERQDLLIAIKGKVDPEAFTYLDPNLREDVLEFLGSKGAAEAITKLDADDAVEIIADLDEAEQKEILDAMPETFRLNLTEQLSYPDSSAGRLMTKMVVAIPQFWTVGDTIDYLRHEDSLPEDFYEIFVMDHKYKPVGGVVLSRLIVNQRSTSVADIMETELKLIPTVMDQEEAANIFRKYGLVSAPVVNEQGRLVGVITVDDIVHVIQEEAQEDIMKMAGVSDSGLYRGVIRTAGMRSPWLFFNLFTGFLTTVVVGFFQGAISHLVVLATLMPVISALGGNVGTQTVTVVVRSLATREITSSNVLRVVTKEIFVCAYNGLFFAIITGLGVGLMYHDTRLGAVFGVSVLSNFSVAGLVGALLPMTILKMKADPAISSGIVLTAITDITGFSIFLGLATLFLI